MDVLGMLLNGRIRTSRLIFHKEHWPEAVAELGRRVTAAN
jgi:hypothetical protein